jgi:hypothetical protein
MPRTRVRDELGRFSWVETEAGAEDEGGGSLHGPVHASRDQEQPSEEPVREEADAWAPPALLSAPPPRPGYVQRWVRAQRRKDDDVTNLRRKTLSGWVPRDVSTIPEGFRPPTASHGEFGQIVQVEGMILCEMPVARYQRRQEYYQRKLEGQTQAIEQVLEKVEQPGHPISRENRTHVTIGTRRPNVKDDDGGGFGQRYGQASKPRGSDFGLRALEDD